MQSPRQATAPERRAPGSPGRLYDLFQEVFLYLDDLARQFLRSYQLSLPQYSLLRHLDPRHGRSISELAALILTHKSSVSRMVDRLAAAGLVVTYRDPSDDRYVRVLPTERGEQVRRAIDSSFDGYLAARLAFLAGAQRDLLAAQLEDVATGLQRQLSRSAAPPTPAATDPAR